MPRSVRNFWVDLSVDGYQKVISGGPRNKEGGFTEEIYIRDRGKVTKAFSISGRAFEDKLEVTVYSADGKFLGVTTTR